LSARGREYRGKTADCRCEPPHCQHLFPGVNLARIRTQVRSNP
jgi:hypothetical protein